MPWNFWSDHLRICYIIGGLEYCLEERHIQLEEDQKRNYEFVQLDRGNKMYRDNFKPNEADQMVRRRIHLMVMNTG